MRGIHLLRCRRLLLNLHSLKYNPPPLFTSRAMRTDSLNKYIWIIDTISAHGRITRAALSELWMRSAMGDGTPIAHRTFFTYRRDIEHIFGIDILCNTAHEYYIDKPQGSGGEAFRDWMLDSYALRHAMDDARDISDRIVVEKVPSARQHLSPLINAIRQGRMVRLTYRGYTRPFPESGILLTPYFLRLYRQRWYVIGKRMSDGGVRTYALDRISDLEITTEPFDTSTVPDAQAYFGEIYGITYSHADAQRVKLRVKPYYANYLRALPMHPSQSEQIYSDCSIFTYMLRITPDLVRELAGIGPDITVLEPAPLVLMVKEQLMRTLENYLERPK